MFAYFNKAASLDARTWDGGFCGSSVGCTHPYIFCSPQILTDWHVSSLTVRGILMLQSGRKVLYFGDRWWHHLLCCHLCLSCQFGMFTRFWCISGVKRKCPNTNGSILHTAKPQKKSGPGMFEQELFADSWDKCYSAPIGLGSVLLWIKGFIELNWCIELPSSGKGGNL